MRRLFESGLAVMVCCPRLYAVGLASHEYLALRTIGTAVICRQTDHPHKDLNDAISSLENVEVTHMASMDINKLCVVVKRVGPVPK